MQRDPTSRTRRLFRAVAVATATTALATVAAAAPARAAAPDRFGFVLYNGVATVPSGTTPAGTIVVAGPPGRYRVIFPGIGIAGGVVHVTAIGNTPRWCQADGWGVSGVDQIVGISCYTPGGALTPSAFSAIFQRSSATIIAPPTRYGYVDVTAVGGIITQYNSAGAINTVAPGGVGTWVVTFPGLTTPGPVAGSLQATAVSPNVAARCKVVQWNSSPVAGQQAVVRCFNGAGIPAASRFTLTYQYQRSLYGGLNPPTAFGYLWNRPPVGPVPTNFDSMTGPGTVTLMPSGVGLSLVRFPRLALLPDNVQVTAAGFGSEFCGLQTIWAHIGPDTVVRNVNCFTSAGAPINTGFLISANSRI